MANLATPEANQAQPPAPAIQPSASPANVSDALDANSGGLSFGDQATQPSEGTLNFGQPAKVIPAGDVPNRAVKYDFALGDQSPGVDTLTSRLNNGEDNQLRDDALVSKELEFRQRKLDVLNSFIKNSPNGVTPDDADLFMHMSQQQFAPYADPKTIMETSYAQKYVTTVAVRDPQQNFQKAEAVAPEATHQMLDMAEWGTARNQITQNKLQDVQEQIKNQSWGSWLSDEAAVNLLPFSNVRLMDAAKSPSVTSALPGKNLEEQVEFLHTLNPIQFNQAVDKALDSIGGNLQLKQQFLQALISYSDSDQVLSNLQTIADIGNTAGGAKAITEAAIGVKSLMKAAVTASKDTELNAAKIAGTTGDFKTAAILNSSPDTKMAGEDTLRNSALSINGGGERWYTGDAQNLSRESTQRFLDSANQNEALAKTFLTGTDRIDRTSLAERLAVRQQAYDELMADTGKKPISSNVLDIDSKGGLSFDVKETGAKPPDVPVTVRLYRGEGAGAAGLPGQAAHQGSPVTGGWFTTDLEKAKRYGNVSYIDVPEDTLYRNFAQGHGGKDEFVTDQTKFRSQMKPYTEGQVNPLNIKLPPGKGAFTEVNTRTGTKFQTSYSPMTNTEAMEITFGKDTGEMFPNQATAQKWADTKLKRFDQSAVSVEPVAGKWVVRLRQDLPDSLEAQKQLVIPTSDEFATNPVNTIVNGIIGKSREQSAILGNANFQARMQVTHGNQRLYDLFQNMLQPLRDLNKDERKNLSYILKANRDHIDPTTGERGKFFNSRSEFENAYRSKWSHLPSEKETTAYYAYVQASDLDGMVRNASLTRDKIRVGAKKVSDNLTIDTPNRAANDPQSKHSLSFEGRKVDSIPFGDGNNTTIAVRDPKTGKVQFIWKERASAKQKAAVEDILKRGGTAWQSYTGHVEIPGGENRMVSHYVSDSAKEGRIDLNGFWRPGGHVVYEDDHYIKQPIARGEFYAGDNAVATAPNAKVAKQRAEAYETARSMMLRNDPNLDQYVSKNIGLGIDGKAFREMFQRQSSNGREIPGLDPNQPFLAVPKGRRTIDVQPSALRQAKPNPYSLADYDKNFTGEREAQTIPALMDEAGVRHYHEEGQLLDPWKSMQDAARSMTDTTLKRDYIIKSAKQFVQQFRDILDISSDRPANRNQVINDHFMDIFYNPQFLKGADPGLVAAANNVRNTILRQTGTNNILDNAWETVKSKLAETTYGTVGDKKYRMLENWMLPFSRNPTDVARSSAFTLKLGLFTIPEMIMQAASWPAILAISPKAGLKATGLYPAMTLARMNPAMLEHSAQSAATFGWKSKDFQEMFNSMMRSGWLDVHGSTSVMDDIANPRMFQSSVGNILHWGQTPFNAGVRFHRSIAYAAAWDEYLTSHAGQMDREGLGWVLQRANTLTQNMSAASNAVWQRGLLAVPAQFFTYQLRLMEQYMGAQLTAAEKMRLFGAQALFFGVPTAVGGAVGVWPVAQSVKAYLQENNIPHDDGAVSAVVGGIPQFLLKLATGSQFDVGEKFGQGGLDVGRAYMRGEKTAWQLLSGAAGSTLSDIYTSGAPFLHAMAGAMNLDPHSNLYPLDIQTVNRVLDNATGASRAIKLGYALETGKWLTKYGTYVGDATPMQAVFNYLTGANLSEINDAYSRQEVLQDHNNLAKSTMLNVVDMYRRGLNETEDPQQRAEYMRTAKAWAMAGGLTPSEMEQALRHAVMGIAESKIDATARALTEDHAKRSAIKNMDNMLFGNDQ